MPFPSFTLKNLAPLLVSRHASEEPAPGHSRGDARANPPQPPPLGDARIAEWARDSGGCLEAAAYHQGDSQGHLNLIGGGGEAVVFGDPERQQVIKLLGGAGKAGFGWIIGIDSAGLWSLRPGGLATSLGRFVLAEEHFPTVLDLHAVGTDGRFLLLRQPFLVGGNPTPAELAAWMHRQGWQPFVPPTRLDMLAALSWRRGAIVATDVRPENAILAEADGEIYPFDFIVAAITSSPR